MREIVKTRNDHGVLYVKLPLAFVREKKITHRAYLEWGMDKVGNLTLKPLKLEDKHGKEFNPCAD